METVPNERAAAAFSGAARRDRLVDHVKATELAGEKIDRFRGQDALRQILTEAQATVDAVIRQP